MKSSNVLTVLVSLVAAPAVLRGQDTAPLGKVGVAAKAGYVAFSEGVDDDVGFYLGIEGYGRVAPNIYVGAEASAAATLGIFTDDMSLGSLELNAKYARALGPNLVLAGGAGFSYSYAEFSDVEFFAEGLDFDDWLFGGQIFADFVFRIKWFELGANAKYQLVEDVEGLPADFSNFRFGLQAGLIL